MRSEHCTLNSHATIKDTNSKTRIQSKKDREGRKGGGIGKVYCIIIYKSNCSHH